VNTTPKTPNLESVSDDRQTGELSDAFADEGRDASPPVSTCSPYRPPVILLGGENNALSVARSLYRAGVRVYAINRPEVSALRSRYLTPITVAGDRAKTQNWRDYLLSDASGFLKGAAIFCLSDDAIKLAVENWAALSERYILEPGPPEMRLRLLDKLSTYQSASDCGVARPMFSRLTTREDLATVARTFRFPVILKPRMSQHSRLIGAKYIRADNAEELERQYDRCVALEIPVVAMEFIPGGDERCCSYYTYIDASGTPLLHFTKRILRRHPRNSGGATYHITDWNPEVAETGLRLFQHVGLRGLGNVEFKRDPRDGGLKLIEVNARYTAGNALVALSGIDLALLSYSLMTGTPYALPQSYTRGLVMLEPIPDFLAFRQLNSRGEITLGQWLRQVADADITPNFHWRDPLPGLHYLVAQAVSGVRFLFAGRGAVRIEAVEDARATLKSVSDA
jgi:predicted ATP-grasp superfamily ATP-dependent carboligase